MLSLNLSNDAMKFVKGLPAKQFRQVLLQVLDLCRDPRPNDSRVLKGCDEGYRRKDIGEFRVVYLATDTELQVILIDKRNDDEVYKKLDRK